jgi:hypothetical protein
MEKANKKTSEAKEGKIEKKDKVSVTKGVKREVCQVGWNNEQSNFGVVLLSKQERKNTGLKEGSIVRVKKGVLENLAVVSKQFKEHISKSNVCTLNTKLAYQLRVSNDEKVTIINDVKESEYADFKKKMPKNPFESLLVGLGDIQ